MKHKTIDGKGGKQGISKKNVTSAKTKKKWVPQHKQFEGSVREGQGFAYKRKQKAKNEYFKLLRREKKKTIAPKNVYKDEFPEHLKHLYLAEKEQLKKEAWANRVNRSKLRMKGKEEDPRIAEAATQMDQNEGNPSITEEAEPNSDIKQTEPSEEEAQMSIPMSNRMRKRMLKKTSYQKTQEEFERIKENRRKKQEEYLKNKQQREEALQKYKQKKMENYQMLCKKTKKGQPNLNLQMEYLLQKIQRTDK
ncbi:thyroid transcription factor 1-associated protein 26 homolog [Boleophthalmus pectinirostris]|uniref:thyroid transcription factor 1-associated protein 26 homolog n=1 Tax=Boleophthalmus pectinirostris TaxID=150288 RepID=UPI000A1C2CB1|nr:thyroid transcription factor 1-associated protein 26 homolog [Boleophthalmus pectinirostris]